MSGLEELYMEHFMGVYRFLLSLARDAALAEELTQETFYRAVKGWKGYRGDCSEYSWLCQIAKNAYFSHRRKRRGEEAEPERLLAEGAADVLDGVLARERSELLHLRLHVLEEPYKEVFTLRIFAGLAYAEIARLFGKNESWARVVFYRAKAKLVYAMKEEDAHE